MIYPHSVTFQEPTEDQQPSGQMQYIWAAVSGLSGLAARIVPVPLGQGDEQGDRMVTDTDRYTIILKGDQAIERTYRATSDDLDHDLAVIQVQRPALLGSPATYATIVTAERIAAGTAAGSS